MEPLEPVIVVELLPLERDLLLQLLASLTEEGWQRPTVCAGWTVKDIALHLLGDDVHVLSGRRDGFDSAAAMHMQTRLDTWDGLVAYINQNNAMWVQATRRMSSRLICTFLALTGDETYQYFRSLDPFAPAGTVAWASPEPAPAWLEIAREYTERWVHQQQMRDALGKPGLKERQFMAPVLAAFVRALPRTFRDVRAPRGTLVALRITGEAGGEWYLQRAEDAWMLGQNAVAPLEAGVVLDQEVAWRLFTKGISKNEALQRAILEGNKELAARMLDTVSIMA